MLCIYCEENNGTMLVSNINYYIIGIETIKQLFKRRLEL